MSNWLVLAVALLLVGCESAAEAQARKELARQELAEARNFDLIKTCTKKHGSPVLDDKGKYKDCKFGLRFEHKKE